MSKICGLLCQNFEKNYIKKNVKNMALLMKQHDCHRMDTWDDNFIGLGHISIGAVNEEIQPIFSAKNNAIIMAGKIFNYETRKLDLIKKGYSFIYPDNDAEFILYLYEEYGTTKFKELNGIFSFCIWDNEKMKMILVNDRYGMRPVYYYYNSEKNYFIFSSELKSISKSNLYNKKINWDAWNIFLRIGFLIEDDTFFKDIFILPQAAILIYDLNAVSIENYWNYNQLKENKNFNEDEDVSQCVHLLKQAMKRRLVPQKKTTVLLSGGLDSAGLAAELKNQGIDFNTYTTRKFNYFDKDRKSAEYISNLLNIENEFLDLPDNFLEKYESQKNNLLDYQSYEHAWVLPLLDIIPDDIKINYDGVAFDIMGDPWLLHESNNFGRELLEARKYEDFIKTWYCSIRCWTYLKWPITDNHFNYIFLSKNIRKKFSSDAFIEKVANQLRKFESYGNQYILFHLLTRTRRSVSLLIHQIILNKLESFCPYLDNDFFDFVLSIPIEARKNRTLRTKILKKISPDVFTKHSIFLSGKDNLVDYHDYFYKQKTDNLSMISSSLLREFRFDIFNPFYLLPRILKNFYILNRFFNSKNPYERQKYFNKCYFRLFQPLHMLNSWFSSEKLKVEN